MRIATIVCRREIARARVLAGAVREHTATTLAVLVLDAEPSDSGSPEPFELIEPTAAGIDDIGVLAAMLAPGELREACKPRLLAHLIAREPAKSVLYLGADSLLCGPIDDIERLALEHGVLVRRRTAVPLPLDGRRPNEADLRRWGLHDRGLIALGSGRDHGELLDWWALHGRDGQAIDGGAPPVDRIATFGAGAHEIDDDGFGASFWDLYGRSIAAHEQSVLIDGTPLRLMRFPGFDVADPLALSDAQNRLRPAEQPALAALCERYAALLRDAGEEQAAARRYGFERLPDRTIVDLRLRAISRRAVAEGGLRSSPFERAGMEAFYAWLDEPASVGAAVGLNRLAMMVVDETPELRELYPNLDHDHHAYGLIGWLRLHGVEAGTLPASLVASLEAADFEADRRRRLSRLNFGVNVAGYFTAELGIGEAARLLVEALDAATVPLLPLSPPTMPPTRDRHPYTALPVSAAGFPINVVCVNADGLQRFHDEVGMQFFENRHNIGVWWWEVDAFPAEWQDSFAFLDELWVGTEHVARALAPVSPIPVQTVRFPVIAPAVEPLPRAALGLDDEWVFLGMFDHGSVIDRKNPIGTIQAFTQAFGPGSGVVLVLKGVNGEHDPIGRERVRAAAAPHPHVRLVEGYLSPERNHALIAAADCFVSLHRAEGFGLVGAEAMALGKPVIATAYSGNLDYMTQDNSWLIDYTLREVGPGCWPYPPHAHWAEVDLDAASRAMREVVEDPGAARERGARAAADLARTHSPAAAGATMSARIESVFARREPEGYLPLPEFHVTLTHGRGGRALRRVAPGVFARLEHELEALWAADEARRFDLRAATRGTMLSTQAATLAALRRVERIAGSARPAAGEAEQDPRAARLDWHAG